ncbi:aspartate kinase [Deltaproteobacteria bacterium OttesenSCG-928-K17]|nr:aspartate kinase [Deltaproteobacteria bacterium OttesenSCG-928-K17]
MALIVQKYGGSSVATLELIRQVAKRAIDVKNQGNQVVVVLSAMKGETDRLLNMAGEMTALPEPREVDQLLATGEQTTVSLFALACQEMGERAKSFTGFQAGISTDDQHQRARITGIEPGRIKTELAKGRVVAVAGFQGLNASGDITTLGRGGTDTTAVALAVALGADSCEIYTDVDGIYTTDPGLCENARKMEKISFEEMLELASLGAKVMEIRSVEFAMNYNMKIHVRHAHLPGEGTVICEEDVDMEKKPVTGVACSKNEARITLLKVADNPGTAAKILSIVSASGIVVDMIIQNQSVEKDPETGAALTDFSFTVPLPDYAKAMELMKDTAAEIGVGRIVGTDNIAKISLVGVGMRNHAGVATQMFQTLAKEGINISLISTSEIKISCIIEKKYTELAVRALHDAFGLGDAPDIQE